MEIMINKTAHDNQRKMLGENALYGREVENVLVHKRVLSPAEFDPELGRRIDFAEAECEKRKLARLQNCRKGAQYKAAPGLTIAQAKAIFYKGNCSTTAPCSPGGSRSRIDWCGDCEKVF